LRPIWIYISGFYEHIKDATQADSAKASFGVKAFAACIAGAASAAICTPADVIKTRMQAQEPFNRKYINVFQAASTIFKYEGIHGLYAAWMPTAVRAAVIAVCEMATYDEMKEWILQRGVIDGPPVHLIAALTSGVISTFFATPTDFIKTRMQSQLVGADGKGLLYRNSFDCAAKSVRNDGFRTLWTGFVPHYLRRGPHLVITYLSLEQIKLFVESYQKKVSHVPVHVPKLDERRQQRTQT